MTKGEVGLGSRSRLSTLRLSEAEMASRRAPFLASVGAAGPDGDPCSELLSVSGERCCGSSAPGEDLLAARSSIGEDGEASIVDAPTACSFSFSSSSARRRLVVCRSRVDGRDRPSAIAASLLVRVCYTYRQL